MRFALTLIVCFLLVLASPGVAQAHGGEDHGDTSVPRDHTLPVAPGHGAAGDLFEAVVTPLPDRTGVTIHLSDMESNAPVESATIDAEMAGSSAWQGAASPTRAMGIYELPLSRPDTAFDLTLTVTVGKKSDLILIAVPAPAATAAAEAKAPAGPSVQTKSILSVAGILLSGVLGYLLGHARGKKSLLPVLLIVVMLSLGVEQAFAHGGEDHGDVQHTEDNRSSGGETTLPKATQFLLGIRTLSVGPQVATATVRLVGRVIPDPSAYARVQPSMTARISHDPNFPVPVSGQQVKRGQPLAALDPNLSANEKLGRQIALLRAQNTDSTLGRELLLAPIDGVVTDVHIVPGEVVTEQTVLTEIIQPERLWVEAVLFDLPLAERITGAMAETRLLPGKRFRLKLMGTSPKLSAEDHGLHILFAVEETLGALRLGIPLDVYAELETVSMPLAIPREALLEKGGQPAVWIKTAPEHFTARTVMLGRQAGAWTEILSGLQAGDKVVVQGQRQLAGMR
ncbi:MAG: efflux RND transporter periplasmic adaptor subunit [Magnetococcales bacterium]|nr:efflux RND transporter periplasmic adaptor subunit [Magnetococcales bacterium]MBF0115276.1 efflux RND transporter periplasmic adaptor subunit [Magnetococcales bacterium]